MCCQTLCVKGEVIDYIQYLEDKISRMEKLIDGNDRAAVFSKE